MFVRLTFRVIMAMVLHVYLSHPADKIQAFALRMRVVYQRETINLLAFATTVLPVMVPTVDRDQDTMQISFW